MSRANDSTVIALASLSTILELSDSAFAEVEKFVCKVYDSQTYHNGCLGRSGRNQNKNFHHSSCSTENSSSQPFPGYCVRAL